MLRKHCLHFVGGVHAQVREKQMTQIRTHLLYWYVGPVPARYVRHSQMCPQLDVSDKNDKKPQDMSDNNYFVFCWHFPEKTLIIPMRIHQAHACTLLNMQLDTYVAQLPSVLYYVLNKMDV